MTPSELWERNCQRLCKDFFRCKQNINSVCGYKQEFLTDLRSVMEGVAGCSVTIPAQALQHEIDKAKKQGEGKIVERLFVQMGYWQALTEIRNKIKEVTEG